MDTVTDPSPDPARSPDKRPLRVLVVDDDGVVRAGLTMMLGGAEDIEVVGEAADGHDAVRQVDSLRPDVVLMDIRMPRMDGLRATKAVMSRPRPPRVIVLTTFDADAHIIEALSAGAEGFLLKDTPPPDIVEAVRRVAAGEPMLSPSVTRAILARLRDSDTSERAREAQRRLAALTDREREVASAVGRGLSNGEIATELHLSVPTVKGHVAQLFHKLGVVNRVQVAMCVHAAGQA
ncbi:response regulator [Nocardioides mesophilus]|uniref:Response regulator transcription factor n=1 Tax=Nocardioides mesophilus TaxID=433659 RepID=A0A7G9RC99_9ACTN|nr:response regulator transcription factor [Nocardioides mesophilus]QNN53224.1 response regulator transcription factor [Nocardioides mesophilus]